MTRLLLAAAAIGTLTGLALTLGTGGAVGVAVCAGAVIVWCLGRAIQTDRRRERDKARHPSIWTPPGGVRPATIIFDHQPRDRSGMECGRCGRPQFFSHKCVDGEWVRGAVDGLVG
jgi:hypothetical protein